MAAYSAMLRGASKVIVVDRHPDRLGRAESIRALAIDDSQKIRWSRFCDISARRSGSGLRMRRLSSARSAGHEIPNLTMNRVIESVRSTGKIGLVGVFVHRIPAQQIN